MLWGIAFWVDKSPASILDWRHTGPTQTVMLHMVTKTMFVVVPSMWMAMMAWAGWSAGGLVDQGIGQVGGAARDAGEVGARTFTCPAGAGVRAASGAVGGPAGVAGTGTGKACSGAASSRCAGAGAVTRLPSARMQFTPRCPARSGRRLRAARIDAGQCRPSTKRAMRFAAPTAGTQVDVRRAHWDQFDV